MNASSFFRSSAALLAMGVLSSVGQAQVLTADTTVGFTGDNNYHASPALGNGVALTQTFSGIDSVNDFTFRFIAHGGSFSATSLTFFLSEWSGNNATGSVAIFTGTFEIDSSSSGNWTVADMFTSYFDSTIDLSSVSGLDNSKVYGLSVVGNAVSASGFTLSSDMTSSYLGGGGFSNAGPVGSFAGLTSGGASATYDFTFTASGGASPVPEASTAAVLFAGVFVGGLMVRRRRRQPADAMSALPVAQA